MRRRDAIILLLVAITGMGLLKLACSCANVMLAIPDTRTIDRTDQRQFWGGYPPGSIFATKRSMLYAKTELDGAFYWPLNEAVQSRVEYSEYLAHPAQYPGVTEIPAGTRIVITEIYEIASLEYSALHVLARFLDGPRAGEKVDMRTLSTAQRDGYRAQYPDSDRIELVVERDEK